LTHALGCNDGQVTHWNIENMPMNRSAVLLCFVLSFVARADVQPSISELRIGFENITYEEKLTDVAGFGKLQQSAQVINPMVRQLSYTGISAQWGVYIDSAATLASSVDEEIWSIEGFDAIQSNAFKMNANEIGVRLNYHFSSELEFAVGGRLSTFSFTRSNFAFVQPGAKQFDDALIALPRNEGDPVPRFLLPGQNVSDADTPQQDLNSSALPVVSVSEEQLALLMVASVRKDTRNTRANTKFSWYTEAEVTTPIYSQTQNTQFNTLTLRDSFNGWGITGRLGLRYHMSNTLALIAGLDCVLKSRSVVEKTLESGKRLRVPELTYSNISYSVGIHWVY
jgi:hypothetical protein